MQQLTFLNTPIYKEQKTLLIKDCNQITGGLSAPSKMPGYSYNLPASMCRTGSKLRTVKGSVCYGCYAADTTEWNKQRGKSNRYAMPNVRDAMRRRLDSLNNPQWVEAMTILINSKSKKINFFRWHDSGDLQSVDHFKKIIKVCKNTPEVSHWLPTREYKIIDQVNSSLIPSNLCVRVSAHMINRQAPPRYKNSSMVYNGDQPENGTICPASQQGNSCGECRACWSNSVPVVAYPIH
jgi:hypothetical protein